MSINNKNLESNSLSLTSGMWIELVTGGHTHIHNTHIPLKKYKNNQIDI